MDKQSGRKFSFSAPKKALISVSAEYGMYDFDFMGEPVSIEPNLARLESQAAEYIARLSREEKFDLADPMERATLACFLAVQMVRTRAVLRTQADMMARMTAWLKTQGAPDGFFEDDPNVGSGKWEVARTRTRHCWRGSSPTPRGTWHLHLSRWIGF